MSIAERLAPPPEALTRARIIEHGYPFRVTGLYFPEQTILWRGEYPYQLVNGGVFLAGPIYPRVGPKNNRKDQFEVVGVGPSEDGAHVYAICDNGEIDRLVGSRFGVRRGWAAQVWRDFQQAGCVQDR